MTWLPLPLIERAQSLRERLTGQRVLITGAAGGLGSALAKQAAIAGAELVLLDKNLAGLEALHDEIESMGLAQPALYPLDFLGASPEDYAELAERLESALGGLDALVHAAADIGQPAPLQMYDIESWLKTLHVNTNAPFLLTQALMGQLRASHGCVILVSDRCGREGQSAMGAYGVSKWALEGLTQTLAAEYSVNHPVRACSVDTGPMCTALRRGAYAGEMADEVPDPKHAARAMLALLDPKHPPKNGGCYQVNL